MLIQDDNLLPTIMEVNSKGFKIGTTITGRAGRKESNFPSSLKYLGKIRHFTTVTMNCVAKV